ncbi:hypothetical protein ACFIOY_32795 [Bradyrhizobium sp. TZ2]
MFEIGIFCVIFLAVSYWAVLWLMGRREDVLHGEFVESDRHADEPVRPNFPERPVLPKRPVRPVFPERPVQAAGQANAPEQPAFRQERLESLLNTIKQDLNQLVRK